MANQTLLERAIEATENVPLEELIWILTMWER